MTYSQDKDTLFKWLMGILGGLAVTVQINTNSKLDELIKVSKDVEYIKEKNTEQDARLTQHDNLLYTKPDEIKVKQYVR